MRDFFINSLETIISVMIILMAIGLVIAAAGVMSTGRDYDIVRGLVLLFSGAVWVLLFGGTAYLGLGIYHNTRRTAEAMEEVARRGDLSRPAPSGGVDRGGL